MKKSISFLICVIFLVSFVSAEIIINQQPKDLYNLGERITIPITITTSGGIYDFLQVSLICNGQEQQLPKEEIDLPANEVIKIEKSIFLIEKFINNLTGTCKIKTFLESTPENFLFTNEFKISDLIKIELEIEQKEFNPGENILVEGQAIKENGDLVNGFLELNIVITENDSKDKVYKGVINNGFFSINFSMPKDTKAGRYLLRLNAYEKDPLGEITNTGFIDYNILIKQVPTSLEIVFENQEVNPGENLKVKAVLHDQTGEKIESSAIMTIKNNEDKIFEQKEVPTDEFLEFPIVYNEPPLEWIVVAVSNKMITNAYFTIKEKEDVKVEIINRTVILTNIGNVRYNKSLLVKIGNDSININANLEVDETKKYLLTAPDGEYRVEIVSDGENKITKNITLTGSAIDVKEISGLALIAKYPVAWFFIIFVLGFVAFMVFRKGYKKSFFGHIPHWKKNKEEKTISKESPKKSSVTDIKNKAELSLSIKGEKQSASIISLEIKNFNEITGKEESTKETLQKITDLAEENNAAVYENHANLFLILAPITTKTFKNERKAVEIAGKIKEILTKHNKLFKQKIDFGISLNYGEIIAKKENNVLKFMSFGNFITAAKKVSSISDKEIYLTEAIKNRLMADVRTEKKDIQGIKVYTIKQIKHKREEHKKFISDFLKRLEGKKEDKNSE